MRCNWLIVGAGYTGAVLAERLASQLGQTVLVVNKRDHIAGNAYDYIDEHGILVHRYGPHIFHTNSQRVWDYLSQFTKWRPYFHRVLAHVEGKQVPVPFNLTSLAALYPRAMAQRLERLLVEQYGFGVKVPVLRMMEDAPAPELVQLAKYIYKNVFEGYTIKQWGLRPEELDSSVTGRIPIYISRDDRYFQDTFQALPQAGYTELFRSLLSHPNIRILLKADYKHIRDDIQYDRMIFTGPIDEFFDYMHGPLPYRSLRFELVHTQQKQAQTVAQLNFPNEHLFTRISEFKVMTGQRAYGTTLAYEYPQPHKRGENDPYYPIPREENRDIHNLYLREAEQLGDRVIFAGRLADYKYYNMDQAVARALKVFEDIRQGPQ